jgi:hypothetical protein
MKSALMLVVLAVLAVVPFLPTASPPPCAAIAAIDHWQFVDERTVVVEGAEQRRYSITFTKACPDAKTGTLALIQRQPSAGACLAAGDAIIFARRTSPTNFKYNESCVIKTITPLPGQ